MMMIPIDTRDEENPSIIEWRTPTTTAQPFIQCSDNDDDGGNASNDDEHHDDNDESEIARVQLICCAATFMVVTPQLKTDNA